MTYYITKIISISSIVIYEKVVSPIFKIPPILSPPNFVS